MITLAIVGIAMSSAAPLISKTMKNSQVGNFQIIRLNKDLDTIKKDIINIKKNYVTNSALTETLKKYVKNDALTKMLERYVTNDNLTSKLGDYAKTSDLPDLTNYATNRDIANFLTNDDLSGYATDAQIAALSQRIDNLESAQEGVPEGTVLFFYNQGCPDGWENIGFDGHYIRITTNNSKVGSVISPSLPNITGGFPGVGEWNDTFNRDWPAEFYDEDKNEKASADGNIKPSDGLYGSFYRRTTVNNPSHGIAIQGGGEREDYFAFNAKYSSNVYGFAADDEATADIDESNEVLPRAIHLVACKRRR